MKISKVLWLALGAAVLGAPQVLLAQNDAALAGRGRKLFELRGCYGCHTFGRHLAGPDLSGVTARRSADWLRRFLADPETMVRTDSTASKLWQENKGYPIMRIQKLNPPEIEALIQYMQSKDAKSG